MTVFINLSWFYPKLGGLGSTGILYKGKVFVKSVLIGGLDWGRIVLAVFGLEKIGVVWVVVGILKVGRVNKDFSGFLNVDEV